jgi:hypothetical protein
MQQMLKENKIIDDRFIDDVILQESVGGRAALFRSLSSKPFLINLLQQISVQIVASFKSRQIKTSSLPH